MGCVEKGDFIACPVVCRTQEDEATSEALQAYDALLACAKTSCDGECTESNGGTGGSDGSGGSGGSDMTDTGGIGGTNDGTGGMGTGGMGTGGASNMIHWLNFNESWAEASDPDNAALGISGGLYAYGDECATFTWDDETRCLSGTLCDPGEEFENWGVAVGFDFNNTGEEGEPADTKMPWNATAQEVIGLAWQVNGTAPGLQIWVTNMAPEWSGACDAGDCAIDGPPDGRSSTALNAVDQVLFNGANFVKDYWGGTGQVYTFDRTNILALQFKLASVVSGAVPFNFCIEQIGAVKVVP